MMARLPNGKAGFIDADEGKIAPTFFHLSLRAQRSNPERFTLLWIASLRSQ
ncbi:MAG: hypothetical protein JHD35_07255 [Sphingopyxis sp.]|nr:hypothetical protein [Sphingopyxis sp.]